MVSAEIVYKTKAECPLSKSDALPIIKFIPNVFISFLNFFMHYDISHS